MAANARSAVWASCNDKSSFARTAGWSCVVLAAVPGLRFLSPAWRRSRGRTAWLCQLVTERRFVAGADFGVEAAVRTTGACAGHEFLDPNNRKKPRGFAGGVVADGPTVFLAKNTAGTPSRNSRPRPARRSPTSPPSFRTPVAAPRRVAPMTGSSPASRNPCGGCGTTAKPAGRSRAPIEDRAHVEIEATAVVPR